MRQLHNREKVWHFQIITMWIALAKVWLDLCLGQSLGFDDDGGDGDDGGDDVGDGDDGDVAVEPGPRTRQHKPQDWTKEHDGDRYSQRRRSRRDILNVTKLV